MFKVSMHVKYINVRASNNYCVGLIWDNRITERITFDSLRHALCCIKRRFLFELLTHKFACEMREKNS